MSTPTRDTSPVRPPTSSGAQEPVTPQRGSPPPVPTGVATAFGPQGFIPDPWVRGDSSGGNTSVDPNGASGFLNVAAAGDGRVPLGVLQRPPGEAPCGGPLGRSPGEAPWGGPLGMATYRILP